MDRIFKVVDKSEVVMISRIVFDLGVVGFSRWKVMLHVQRAESVVSNELTRVKFPAVQALPFIIRSDEGLTLETSTL